MRLTIAMLVMLSVLTACATSPRLNEIQFVGSHNSYKVGLSADTRAALATANPAALSALDYAHRPLAEQLDLGIRQLELDIFNNPADGTFPVGHVQVIDMRSHCAELRLCLRQVNAWSTAHPRHVPLWISFNLKDEHIDGLPDPIPFDAAALNRLDSVLREELGTRILPPGTVGPPHWPRLDDVRGTFVLILDEGGAKQQWYERNWRTRPMFMNVDAAHPAAAVMILNDPIEDFAKIGAMVRQGFLVRTRADADTREARLNDTARRDAAFASGAHAVSTDYYLPATQVNTDYVVAPRGGPHCNPVTSDRTCRIRE
ncbi:MAG: hypothetical protein H6993_08580 [Pseudomonadales bacterium]|nr:hypothetical protein [Pseudomonadales bacterium]MCP5184002.1 hypothetical protein [Pseudomonadales bacterium]